VANVVTAPPDNDWRDAVQEELLQLIDDMLHTEKTHLAAGERLGAIHRRLGMLATVLATVAGATILSNSSKLAAGLIALSAAVVSAVLTFMKPDKAAEQHLSAGCQLGALRVKARQVLNLDLHWLSADELRAAIKAVADEKANIDAAAPGTDASDYVVARKEIMAGTFERDR
jgi:hypothetical protein